MTFTAQSNGILRWTESNINGAPNATGVYILRDANKNMLYIGRNTAPRRLRDRILDHWRTGEPAGVQFFDWYQTDNEESAGAVEREWIDRFNPPYNRQ